MKNQITSRMQGHDYLIWVILLISLTLIPSILHGQEKKNVSIESVCFSEADTYRLVNELERCKIIEKINEQLTKQNEELTKQITLYQEQIKVLHENTKALDTLLITKDKIYKAQIEQIEKIHKEKDQAYEDEINEAKKPKFGTIFGSIGIGMAATALILLLL